MASVKNIVRWILLLFIVSGMLISCAEKKKKLLVFSKTTGYRHESIADGKLALIKLGQENNFEVDTTEDASAFQEENLKQYDAVVFLSTTQDVLNPVQQGDFKRYIEAGGGFVGIHAAADTEYEWPWFGKLIGAYFKSHPEIQEATLRRVGKFDDNNLPETWTRKDEWYNYKNISKDINVIYQLDETSYKGGENGENHPIAWYHEFQGGRVFYTGLGHTKESYADSLFLNHVLSGIKYAAGDGKRDYTKVKSQRVPEEDRFTKTVLDFNLNEPTEMTILPDGKILFVERKGHIKLYTPADNKVSLIDSLEVGTKFEDGIIGITADPNFAQNNLVYIFYSHPEKSANILSRFAFRNDKLDHASEIVMLEVATQRETCCHTGGSLVFDTKGNLFISTGDNTSPFESDGYSPSDERKGRYPFDAQGSSANSNDLRGKILRIHPEPDGTYTIPDGNLFPKGTPKTRPEIYVMGCRNPYRISLDQRTGYLYWGEVGPDAGQNDSLRGPRGYDEVNQARGPGFFGWPYFVGNNYNYAKYDFASRKVGAKWDHNKPINESPNNTGIRELPPVSPAFVYYPYAKSDEFPMVKDGGRNAMAGPVYYSDAYPSSSVAFPKYFDGKLLMYDWMRNWMFLVSMDSVGDIMDIEPFMPNTRFNNIIDMAYGPEGKLYMLEYGTGWFKQNLDARLVRIDYNAGNRPPVAQLSADRYNGSLPLKVTFDPAGTRDPDGGEIKLELKVAGKTYQPVNGKFEVSFDKPGSYQATLEAKDKEGATGTSKLQIIAGNSPPVVTAKIIKGNSSYYFPKSEVVYEIRVTDEEDGSSADGKISADQINIGFDFVKGYDMTGVAQGHQRSPGDLPGKGLIDQSDCKSCHLIDQRSAGPGYKEVARKYRGQDGAVDRLAAKIIKGGAGVWGTTEMAAHPQISVDDAKLMVEYILSLGEDKQAKRLPLKGSVRAGAETDGAYLLTASYMDKGVGSVSSLGNSATIVLKNPLLKAETAADLKNARLLRIDGQTALEGIVHGSGASFRDIDLTDVRSLALTAYIDPRMPLPGGYVEVYLDKQEPASLLGTAELKGTNLITRKMNIKPVSGKHTLVLVFKNDKAGEKNLFYFGGIQLGNR